jgi:hypothetical protein
MGFSSQRFMNAGTPSARMPAAAVFRPGFGLEARCDNEFRIQEKNALRRGTAPPFSPRWALSGLCRSLKG